jgi:hypothetical protein
MATQNINAEMIEGIDLLTNYSGFALADGGYIIALNLHTKDSYKISGFLMSNWVMESIMPSTLILLNFFKKGNLAILSDYNTIERLPYR